MVGVGVAGVVVVVVGVAGVVAVVVAGVVAVAVVVVVEYGTTHNKDDMKPERMKRALERAGVWAPKQTEICAFQRVGYSHYLGYTGVLVEWPDGRINYLCSDLSKEELSLVVGSDEQILALLRRQMWLQSGGDPALLHELEA